MKYKTTCEGCLFKQTREILPGIDADGCSMSGLMLKKHGTGGLTMANKPCMGLIRCQCGRDVPVVWNGNHSFSCPFCNRKLNVKRQRMKKVRHVDPVYFNSGRADN